jgi:hypothetical protein
MKSSEIAALYANFDSPITKFDCGTKCAPYNPGGKPFCCDICHAVPTAYTPEWEYLQPRTNLWHEWRAEQCTDTEEERLAEVARLQEDTPDTMILLECLGPSQCERDFRALTCRQFPFFPYVDSQGEFIGLSYYWEYEDVCWVVSNLAEVTDQYRREFVEAFDLLFERWPEELETYRYHAEVMRDEFNERHRSIPLLHRDGGAYKISTHNERMRRVPIESLARYGPYKLAAEMPFLDEI